MYFSLIDTNNLLCTFRHWYDEHHELVIADPNDFTIKNKVTVFKVPDSLMKTKKIGSKIYTYSSTSFNYGSSNP